MPLNVPPPVQSVPLRLAERSALIVFALYHVPLFLNNYPSLGGGSGGAVEGLAVRWGHLFTRPGIWLARILFGLTGPMVEASSGDNGDYPAELARLILSVVIGVIGGIAWVVTDRRRPGARWAEGALRVLLRYSIVLGLASYAVAKLVPQQFPPLTVLSYETRVGELGPMRLLWTFMQYSRPYSLFGGLMEVAAIVLLCFRRTATLGALTTVAVMTNVTALNLAYDVSVKLYSTMMVASAGVLVLYDARRLLGVFVTNTAVPPARQATILEGWLPASLRWGIKLVLVGGVFYSSFAAYEPGPLSQGAVAGAWCMTSFTREGGASDETTLPVWRRLMVESDVVGIRLDDEVLMRCRRTPSADVSTLAFTCSKDRTAELRWTLAGGELHLDGVFAGAKVTVSARRLDAKDYPLMRGGFHAMYDQ